MMTNLAWPAWVLVAATLTITRANITHKGHNHRWDFMLLLLSL
jgi:hypothetical protein